MSILIKDMQMPTCCDNCWALDDYGDYPRCRITEEQRGYNFPIREKRMDTCPIVELPPHGRLIDADAADSQYKADFTDLTDFQCGWNAAMRYVCADAPTVIEAEGEDKI